MTNNRINGKVAWVKIRRNVYTFMKDEFKELANRLVDNCEFKLNFTKNEPSLRLQHLFDLLM